MIGRRETSDSEKSGKTSDTLTGFHYFQTEICGYNSCVCGVAHYHCQMCGYGTSELSHTRAHRESCSRVKSHFSQSPCLSVSGNSQGSDHAIPATYESGPDPSVSTLSSSVSSTMQISNTSNHLYYRSGSQQSSMFNPLLTSQSQTLYSGVFGSQMGFSNQNNYPPSFNSFTHVEPPPWLSDSRMTSSANSTPSLDVGRNKTLNCNSQGMSHSCCGNRVGGLLENMGLCSPLASDSFKSLNKESTSCQHKSAISMENQNWFCGQGMLGYGSQISGQGIQNTMYKCSEPFPSCTMSQLGIPINEQDLKHTTMCYEPNSKTNSSLHVSRKSTCSEVSREPCSKISMTQKPLGQISEYNSHSPCMQSKEQEPSSFDNQSVFPSVENEMQEEIYSQNPPVQQITDDRTMFCHLPKSTLLSQQSLSDSTKYLSSTLSSQASTIFSRCNLPICDGIEGYLQFEGQPLYQYPQPAPATLSLDEDQCSNPGSCSAAAESDIVVEESDEEVLECEVSVEDIKKDSHLSCFVCSSSNARCVHLSTTAPLTSTTHIPVVTKLAEVMLPNNPATLTLDSDAICHRCLNLVDTLDSLENKLTSVKKNIIDLYSGKNLSSIVPKNSEMKVTSSADNNISEKIVGTISNPTPEASEKSITDPSNVINTKENLSEKEEEEEEEESIVVEENSDEREVDKIDVNVDDETELSSEDELKDAEKEVNGEMNKDLISCRTCKSTFTNEESLKEHSHQHIKSMNYFCDRCGRGFVLLSGLESHLLSHKHEHRYQCEVCGKCFTQKNVLEDHLLKHTGAFRLSCAFCKKGFLYASSLKIHERTHTGERPYICQHCGKMFICLSNLTSHLSLCKGDKTFSCKQCDKVFLSSYQLKSHFVTSHESDPQYKCKNCGKVFTKACDLKVHHRVHSGEKPHQCSVCGKNYSSVGNLNQHAKKHSEDKPFKCDLCGKGFLRKAILERHKNQHSGERPYKCTHCDKTFGSAHNLHAHTKLHTGNMKKYTCSVCGKTMNHGLKVHMRTHSGDKPYTCLDCGTSFSVKSTLDKHIKLKHERIT